MSPAPGRFFRLSNGELFLLSLCAALGIFWYGASPPRLLSPDTIDFLSLASCLEQQVQGRVPHCEGAGHWALGHPLALALVQQLPLQPVTAVRLLSLVPASLLCFPLFWLARGLGGARAGLLAALLSVSLVPVRLQALMPDARTGALLLIALAYAGLVGWLQERRVVWLAAVGVLLGGAISFRPEAKLNLLLVVGVVGLVALLEGPRRLELATAGRGWLTRAQEVWKLEGRQRLLELGKGYGWLGLGLAGVLLPLQYILYSLTGRLSWEPRAWEVPIVGWMAYLPVKLFLPLFELGALPRPLRTVVQQQLEQAPEASSGLDRLAILVQQLPENLAQLPLHLEAVVSLPLLALAWVGGQTLWGQGKRGALALWSLWLLPLGLLIFLPQTYNQRMPESNLLFVPVSLCVLAGVGGEALLQRLKTHSGGLGRWGFRLGWGLGLVGLLVSAQLDLRERLQARGEAPFEASSPVQAAAAWLRRAGKVQVLASFGAACVPYLGGQERLAAPSFWEVPVTLELLRQTAEATGKPRLLALTSVDAADDPLLVREWLRVTPPLDVVFFSEAQGQWVALLRVDAARGAE